MPTFRVHYIKYPSRSDAIFGKNGLPHSECVVAPYEYAAINYIDQSIIATIADKDGVSRSSVCITVVSALQVVFVLTLPDPEADGFLKPRIFNALAGAQKFAEDEHAEIWIEIESDAWPRSETGMPQIKWDQNEYGWSGMTFGGLFYEIVEANAPTD